MNRNNIEFVENEAFDKKVNIELCNELINFIIQTSNNNSNDIVKSIEEKCIWFKKKDITEIQNICEIEYFGELLERYEQKVGNDIKNIRAISLALGYAKELVTDNMIVGTQLIDFIHKIENIASNDIFLQATLYLCDNKKYSQYKKELLNRKYTNTEDILFVLALFDDKEETFNILNDQIVCLLGKNKTISAINNIKIYAWLINNFYIIVKKSRKKDIVLFKSIIEVPIKQIKEGSEVYKILYENGYTKDEIAYLNYATLFYVNIPKTVRLGNSITEERIAINFCKTFLDNPNEQHQAIYRLIENMIQEYSKFDIKCGGNENLKEAIKYEININNPITFLHFYNLFNREIYRFNILEEKWNIIAQKMEISMYKQLFDKFIVMYNYDKEKLEKCIEKYNKLTNTSYLESFLTFDYGRDMVFEDLVNKSIILLEEYYDRYEQEESDNNIMEHIRRYVSGIHFRNAFLFLKYIIEDKKQKIENINKFGFDLRTLYNVRRYSYYREECLDIEKNFLSKEEKEKLFFWLDNYMFKVHPNEYLEFVVDMLKTDNIKNIISIEQLREIYFMLVEYDNEGFGKNEYLRSKYLTQEELQDIINRENEEKEQKKMQEFIEKQKELVDEFNKLSKQSFEELYNYCDRYEWRDKEWKICSEIVKKYLYENIEDFEVNENEITKCMEMLTLLLKKKAISIQEFKEYIFRYIKEEELDNGIIKRAC